MVGMLVGLPATARALQMPMASDIEKENAGQTDLMRANWLKFNPTGSRAKFKICLLYTSPSPRDKRQSRMPSSA